MTDKAMPSAHDLGISTAHRRSILRETHVRTLLRCARQAETESAQVRATERIGATSLVIVGGEPAAQEVRDGLSRTAQAFRSRAATYLWHRAQGVSARDALQADLDRRVAR